MINATLINGAAIDATSVPGADGVGSVVLTLEALGVGHRVVTGIGQAALVLEASGTGRGAVTAVGASTMLLVVSAQGVALPRGALRPLRVLVQFTAGAAPGVLLTGGRSLTPRWGADA